MNDLRAAFRDGMRSLRGATGGTVDPQLAIYKKLTPKRFKQILKRYGLEGTAQYVFEMEKRLAREGK